jgi:hypothetical protein
LQAPARRINCRVQCTVACLRRLLLLRHLRMRFIV